MRKTDIKIAEIVRKLQFETFQYVNNCNIDFLSLTVLHKINGCVVYICDGDVNRDIKWSVMNVVSS